MKKAPRPKKVSHRWVATCAAWSAASCASAGLMAISGQAMAQAALPEATPTLRAVVVTATPGIAQSAFDAPASIDVIGANQLQNAQLQINLS